jgi:protein-L-isoaspartate O-methyltransferase
MIASPTEIYNKACLLRSQFDTILVNAAAEHPLQALLDRLKPGGHLLIRLGPEH